MGGSRVSRLSCTRPRRSTPSNDDGIEQLQRRIRDKHGRNLTEGQLLEALREIRVRASPSWDAPRPLRVPSGRSLARSYRSQRVFSITEAMYTLIETVKLNGVDPRAWLADVLARLPGHPASRVHELLPLGIGESPSRSAPPHNRSRPRSVNPPQPRPYVAKSRLHRLHRLALLADVLRTLKAAG